MPTKRHVVASALLVALTPFVATAQAQGSTPSLGVFGWREQLLACFDRMPIARLETAFLRCSRESSRRMLSFDDAVPCGIAWDTLLRRSFDGNVEALLSWWRTRRDDPEGARPSGESVCD